MTCPAANSRCPTRPCSPPGAEIEIRAGYGATEDTIFKGVVIAHGVRLGDAGPTQLVVECRDRAVAATVDRRSAVHLETTDGEILSRLIGGYEGLHADEPASAGMRSQNGFGPNSPMRRHPPR